MQAASSPYFPSLPQPYYQNIYHIQPLAPQDHELKRQYLALLPPQQIIEICLTFDVHVPPYIKSTVWPPDINVAIANLRKPTVTGDASSTSQKDNDKPPEPVMASLEKPPEENNTIEPGTSTTETQMAESQPPDKPTDGATTTTAATVTQTPAPPTTAPQPPTPAASQVQQQSYPHQPYGYPQHPPAAYPHAPYYPHPPGYPSYPPSSYPHYPPVPNGYPHPHPHPHPSYLPPPPPNSVFPTPHVPQPPAHPEQGSDDLPSYEEMIVEALQESTDPEGCAPKDLFAWMAARYPLQSNFRPSASQALQKAYKRGRFEKSNNGKYRLSASWEGGNTSRRTTRRPQTQSQSQTNAMSNSSGSPFTHAPLVHHHQQQQNAHSPPYPGQPYPHPYGGPIPPGYPGYPHPQAQPQVQPQLQATASEAAKTTAEKTTAPIGEPSSDVDRDTYEAAQNILKAINFGDLFQIAAEGGGDGKKADDVSVDQLTSLLVQAQNAISQQVDATASVVSPPTAPLPTLSASAGVAIARGNVSEPPTNVRAELQAQLALLAAQLAELSQEDGEATVSPSTQPQAVPPLEPQPQMQPSEAQQPSGVSSSIFNQPFMDALLPPDFSLPGPQAQAQIQQPTTSSASLPSQPEAPQEQPPPTQQEDIPIDPVLQGLEDMVEEPSVAMPATQFAQLPAVDPALTVDPQSSASVSAAASLVAPPPPSLPTPPPRPPPPVFAATEPTPTLAPASTPTSQPAPPTPEPVPPEPEPHVTTPNFVDGETDGDDDDMEEIA